jgi:hypothetical protein
MELIEYKEMREAIHRVRELHKPYQLKKLGNSTKVICVTCVDRLNTETNILEHIPYPCPTIKALDGEQ